MLFYGHSHTITRYKDKYGYTNFEKIGDVDGTSCCDREKVNGIALPSGWIKIKMMYIHHQNGNSFHCQSFVFRKFHGCTPFTDVPKKDDK